jgi:tetraspanin-13/31
LAASTEDELEILGGLWKKADNTTKNDVEKSLDCCGWETKANHTSGDECSASCFQSKPYACNTCSDRLTDKVDYAFNSSGGVGLFFAFTEIIGTVLAYRFRNLANPRLTPPGNVYSSPTAGIVS